MITVPDSIRNKYALRDGDSFIIEDRFNTIKYETKINVTKRNLRYDVDCKFFFYFDLDGKILFYDVTTTMPIDEKQAEKLINVGKNILSPYLQKLLIEMLPIINENPKLPILSKERTILRKLSKR